MNAGTKGRIGEGRRNRRSDEECICECICMFKHRVKIECSKIGGALRWFVPVEIAIRFYDLLTWNWISIRKETSMSQFTLASFSWQIKDFFLNEGNECDAIYIY